jgi:hypothetical protein
MSEPCDRCGTPPEGDCPAAETSTADGGPEPEACAFCGERHPAGISCARWAQETGSATQTAFGGAAGGERTAPVIVPRKPRRSTGQTGAIERLAPRIGVGVLALIGAVAVVRFVAGRVSGGSGATSAGLPACSVARIRANLTAAATIESESGAALPARVAATNALLLGPSDGCSQQLYLLYTAYIDDASLCLSLSAPASCQARDAVHAQLNQALESGQ